MLAKLANMTILCMLADLLSTANSYWQRRPIGRSLALLSLLAAGTLAVGVTWLVGDRFLVSMLLLITLFASLGTWNFLLSIVELSQERLFTTVRLQHTAKDPQPND